MAKKRHTPEQTLNKYIETYGEEPHTGFLMLLSAYFNTKTDWVGFHFVDRFSSHNRYVYEF